MADVTNELLKTQLRQLRLPTMGREFEKLAQGRRRGQSNLRPVPAPPDRTGARRPCHQRGRHADQGRRVSGRKRLRHLRFQCDAATSPSRRSLELARCEWIAQKSNCCLMGSHGTGKTHISIGLGLAACRAGLRVRFFTAAELVSRLEKEQKQYTLDRFLTQLDRAHLLICDELGYVTMSRGGVELLFRVFADRYERGSILVTSNLPFSEWNQIFQGERMTAALLDRLTHHSQIFEMNGESYRFRESMKTKKGRKSA